MVKMPLPIQKNFLANLKQKKPRKTGTHHFSYNKSLHTLNFICPKFRKLQLQKFMNAVINEKNQQQLFKELPLRNNEKQS